MATTPFPSRGLYAVTDSALCRTLGVAESVREVIQGGAVAIQYRDKSNNSARRLQDATLLLEICRRAGVPLIVNDDLALASEIGADGVHIGRDDGTISRARAILGSESVIGVSCYDSVDLGVSAQTAGASYVAFGSFFPSRTKPSAPPVDIDSIARRRREIQVPVVAIGGINPVNAAPLIASGIDLVAVVSGLFASSEPRSAARQFSQLF
jgi:thiamine-phosphate pyrophosphorylase